MINNIFSIFDPSSSYKSIRWIILFIPPIILITLVVIKNSKTKKILITLLNNVEKEIKQLIKEKKKNSSLKIITKTFILIISLNVLALIPFNFTPTAHISITLSISITMWLSVIIWGWINSFKSIMIHITPTGTPNQLINFIVIIEIIRNLIRPITLSVRLSANIVAGHLLILLLSNFSLLSQLNTYIGIIFMIILTTLEIIVALIQAYVLTILISLYHNERLN